MVDGLSHKDKLAESCMTPCSTIFKPSNLNSGHGLNSFNPCCLSTLTTKTYQTLGDAVRFGVSSTGWNFPLQEFIYVPDGHPRLTVLE